MPGTKNEYGEIHRVANYRDWAGLHNQHSSGFNCDAFFLPRIEYCFQIFNFWLDTTLFQILERLGHLSIFPAIVFFLWRLLFGGGDQ